MNILLLAPQPFFQQRGTPIAVRMLAQELAAQGHAVDLLVFHEGEDVTMPGVTLHRTWSLPGVRNVPPGFSLKKVLCDGAMFFKCIGLLARRRYDLIHAVEESAFLALVLSKCSQVPYVYDMDSSMPEQIADKWKLPGAVRWLLEMAECLAVRHSRGVVAVCRSLEDKARRFDPKKRVVRLEDVSLLEPVETGPILRDELGIEGPIVLYVGNLESYQGIDLLLETFAHARRSKAEAHLVVIGGVREHIEHYRKISTDLGIADAAHFVGPRPLSDLQWYLAQADVLVSPRTQGNNTPMKIYSYLDSGRAVLATRRTTHTQALDDRIAMLADPEPEAMGAALVELLRDGELRARLATRARTRVAQEFSPQAFRRKLAEFYRNLEADLGAAQRPVGREARA